MVLGYRHNASYTIKLTAMNRGVKRAVVFCLCVIINVACQTHFIKTSGNCQPVEKKGHKTSPFSQPDKDLFCQALSNTVRLIVSLNSVPFSG